MGKGPQGSCFSSSLQAPKGSACQVRGPGGRAALTPGGCPWPGRVPAAEPLLVPLILGPQMRVPRPAACGGGRCAIPCPLPLRREPAGLASEALLES